MQKLNGVDLGKTTEFGGPRVLKDREKVIICQKIDEMHRMGIIHNDLHQGNIFLDKKEPYIIDFGFSQIIQPNDGSVANFMNNLSKTMQERAKWKTLKNLLIIYS